MLRIAHIHTDAKFVKGTRMFFGPDMEHLILFIGSPRPPRELASSRIYFFDGGLDSVRAILKLCENMDVVVLYDLNFLKSYIANRLPHSVIVIWRFFGYELYGRIAEQVLSHRTREVMSAGNTWSWVRRGATSLLAPLRQYSKYNTTAEREFRNAIRRTDYFLGLSWREYQWLKARWPALPEFLQIPFSHQAPTCKTMSKKSAKIVVGNSRNCYNNHLDVLEIILSSQSKHDYEYLLFFSYGREGLYAESVRAAAAQIPSLVLQEEFLSPEEFKCIYVDAAALVINAYRQFAMGNILLAIRAGCKVYLSNENPVLGWLIEEGFAVFSLEDFARDIESNGIALKMSEAERNLKSWEILTERYGAEEFFRRVRRMRRS